MYWFKTSIFHDFCYKQEKRKLNISNSTFDTLQPSFYPWKKPNLDPVNVPLTYQPTIPESSNPYWKIYNSQFDPSQLRRNNDNFGSSYPYFQNSNSDLTKTNTGDQLKNENFNVKTDILDVDPEYQRQLLGLSSSSNVHKTNDQKQKPRYKVNVQSNTWNVTSIPSNLTKPIVTEKKYLTSIRRTFVYDSSKPGNFSPINLHIVNGQPVTTPPPPQTTVNEEVEKDDPKSNQLDRDDRDGLLFRDLFGIIDCKKGFIKINGRCIRTF
ncbi:hypothetical protein ABEB36_004566 [Hypothenemus hampei]|uniref:Uncharacterized protein n=1 Tax=Hypothenemus hampei TaxID=57062 RepID=A0ABD1F3S0_HYPHA